MRQYAASGALALALVAYAALAYGYITLTPIWQNPDEPAHFNYVAFVAETGGLPVLQQGDWDSGLLDRLKNGAFQPGDSISKIRYESWQPPLFYLVTAPLFRLGAPDPVAALYRLRAFDAVLGGLTLLVAYLVARLALPPPIGAAVPLTLVGVPMFMAVSAAVSADPLANVLSAGLLLVLLQQVVNKNSRPVVTGGLLGLGLLTKLALGIFAPIALIVVAICSVRPVRDLVLLGATTTVVMAPWLVHQVTTYGWTDPFAFARHAAVVTDQERFSGLSQSYLTDFGTITFHSFWAQFGWMAIVAPPRLYWFWGTCTLLALVGLAMGWRSLGRPPLLLLLGTLAAAFVGYVGYNVAFVQFQGRYLFPALVPIAILLVAGWAFVVPATRLRMPVVLLVALTLVLVNAYTLLRILVLGFAPPA